MDVREKLVELLHKGVRCPGVIDNCNDCPHHSLEKPCDEFGATVDMLIANGVTVQGQVGFNGEWIVNGQEVFCSHCNEESGYNAWGASAFSNYCPNCGTKMMPQPLKGE